MTRFRHIVEFLESEHFKKELFSACENFQILSEADLQVFVCRKLVELFSITPDLRAKYRVNAEPFCRELKLYPDIAIFRRRTRGRPDQPVIAIELKETHVLGSAVEQDCQKLRQYRDQIGVRRAYLIHLVHAGDEKHFQRTLDSQKKGLKNVLGIAIVMQERFGSQSEYDEWHRRRDELMKAFAGKLKKRSTAQAAAGGL